MSAGSALIRKTIYHSANAGRLLRSQSHFKVIFILSFALLFEAGLGWMFIDGFNYLHRLGGIGLLIISKLFGLFFLAMGLMLAFSSIVSSYSTIYRSTEIPFLLTRPFSVSQIVLYKFFESTGLSSWAFFFIIIPFLGAYAWHEKLSPTFALWTFLFSIPFVILCSGLGTLLTILFVRWVPRIRLRRPVVILLAGLAVSSVILFLRGGRTAPMHPEMMNMAVLLPGINIAANPLLPSWWISEGIMGLTRGQALRGSMLLGMTLSSAVMICLLIEWLGGKLFYDGWQRLTGAGANRTRAAVLFPALQHAMSITPGDVRAIVMKDIRTFFRDPLQWSQALIFFGLLFLYFSNLRTFRYHILPDNWRNTIAFLNVFSVSSVVCSLGSRFIYPQLSLEGHGFWILGLSPAKMSRILMTKFITALTGILVVSTALMLLSSWMLNASVLVRTIAVLVSCSVSLAVCGLSTGLGAIFLDLDQRNPAAIVSGFGGTLNLVLCLGFMIAAIFPFALIFHLHLTHRITLEQQTHGLAMAAVWLLALTAITVTLPLRLGLKSLETREY